MAAPTLQPNPTLEDGDIILVFSEVVTAVDPSTATIDVSLPNRSLSFSFLNDEVTFDGSNVVITIPQPVYIGDTIIATIGADFVENGSSEGNALIEGQAILNRSVTPYPTRSVDFSLVATGSVTFSSPDGSVALDVKTSSVEFTA